MTARKDTRFKPGQSGNPAGRAPGSGWIGEARKKLQEAWDGTKADGSDGIRKVLLDKAKGGDMAAIRLVAERVCPPVKAVEPEVEVPLAGETLTQKAEGVLGELAQGRLSTTQAAQLMQALGALAKVIETDELARRIEALEKAKP